MLTQLGYGVTGIDTSANAIDVARSQNHDLDLHVGSAYDELAASYGRFPVVLSLEVVEHCYYPYRFARTFRSLLAEAGVGIISTPYHGYWKNLALAVTGRLDSHFTALWEGGHIKFWSVRTLTQLLVETGFRRFRIVRAGRIPPLAKSMIAIIEG
jgi:2-polyprenyl-6-hydroxyphenyl methylase/3-demethylubiquinone-9 3-methyltransferase